METNYNNKRTKAKKRIAELKGFYIHLTVFVLVNLFIISATVATRVEHGERFAEAFFNFGTFSTFIFWGLGLGFHATKVFSYNLFFNKGWEERQIQKYMDKDRRDADKYK